MTAHSASDMSEGYLGILVLRPVPPGQHRHATAGVPWACAGSAGSLISTNRDRGTRACLSLGGHAPRRLQKPYGLLPQVISRPGRTPLGSVSKQALSLFFNLPG